MRPPDNHDGAPNHYQELEPRGWKPYCLLTGYPPLCPNRGVYTSHLLHQRQAWIFCEDRQTGQLCALQST